MTIFAKENLKKRCIFLSDMRKKHVVHYVGITNADATENDTMDEKFANGSHQNMISVSLCSQ